MKKYNQKLSVALAVFNEEKNLPDCLSSVKDLAWEIVIVDGGSTDKTVEIARGYKARILQTDNPPIFHINKNKAIDATRGDWVLQLDADEIVTSQLAAEIVEKIELKDEYNGYWIPRSNFFLGRFLKKGGQYPDYTLRLYKKGIGRLPAKDVHEQAVVLGAVGYLKNPLLHLRDVSFKKYLSGLDRYTSIMALQMRDKRERVSLHLALKSLVVDPCWWFLKTYIRHKGFADGWQGFVFAFFSSLRFPIAFFKYITEKNE